MIWIELVSFSMHRILGLSLSRYVGTWLGFTLDLDQGRVTVPQEKGERFVVTKQQFAICTTLTTLSIVITSSQSKEWTSIAVDRDLYKDVD